MRTKLGESLPSPARVKQDLAPSSQLPEFEDVLDEWYEGYSLYSTVQYSTVQYSTVQYITAQHSTVQYSTVQYSTVQYSTVQYSTVQYSTVQYSTVQYRSYLEALIQPLVQPPKLCSTMRNDFDEKKKKITITC